LALPCRTRDISTCRDSHGVLSPFLGGWSPDCRKIRRIRCPVPQPCEQGLTSTGRPFAWRPTSFALVLQSLPIGHDDRLNVRWHRRGGLRSPCGGMAKARFQCAGNHHRHAGMGRLLKNPGRVFRSRVKGGIHTEDSLVQAQRSAMSRIAHHEAVSCDERGGPWVLAPRALSSAFITLCGGLFRAGLFGTWRMCL